MKLLVDRLTSAPVKHSFSGSEAWWKQYAGRAAEIATPVDRFSFELIASAVGADLHLEGEVVGLVEVECSRCVARYRHAIREPFRLVLEPVVDRIPSDPEGAEALNRDGLWLGDDFESGWYRGSEIDLESYLAEVLGMAMPVQPLCRDKCAGLCQKCGANRNESDCGCSKIKPNSPFAVLGSLRTGQSGGKP